MSDELENLNSRPDSGGHGGARSGSGRKRKHDKHGTAIERAERQIRDRLPELIAHMFELASGVLVEETSVTGAPAVYQKPPDYRAAAYLIDRIMGKPTERRELTFPKPLNEMSDDELRAIAES